MNLVIKVIIADDHTIVRHGLKQILNSEPGIKVVAEAGDGHGVLHALREDAVDVVVMDITMPGRSGLETLKEIKHQYPDLPVLILSMHPSDQYAVRVLKAGASGYLTKESAPDELVAAIKKVNKGEKYISPPVAELLASYIYRGSTEDPHKLLSDREFEVLRLIASGKGATQISEDLNLSVKTVSTYRARIIEKTGLASNAEMTRYAIEHGIV